MAFKLIVRNKLRVTVKGSMPDENGKQVPFIFVLLCKRLSQSQIEDARENKDELVVDFIKSVTEGWEDVNDADGQPMPFDEDNFAMVMDQAGMPGVCFNAYMKEIGAVAKN